MGSLSRKRGCFFIEGSGKIIPHDPKSLGYGSNDCDEIEILCEE